MQHNERETRESEDTVVLKSEVLALESKITEQHAQILRAKADLENNRRRAEKEIEKVRLYSLTKYNEALIPVIDSLELAISNLSEVDKHHAKGLEITYEMLISTVNKFGLVSINPLGEKFDPKYHDAIATEASGANDGQHIVKSVLQKGYLLNDRVIRPAMVVVAN